jgi:hypothetical protein
MLAFFLVSLRRLEFHQLVDLGAAIIQFATAPVELLQVLIGVGPALPAGDADDETPRRLLGNG